ncbi:MAG TPA: MFS transporter [Gaiellaceae bacterium]|jgi:MFS family permease|nr:MFS transporter [Gaiellaceae bacterium]
MRRILLLVGAIVLVDTIFFSALTPLLPHYSDSLGLGKTGAGALAGAYPAGCLLGAIPSGVVAARWGVKPTVLVGLLAVAFCTVLFGFGTEAWQLDLARFAQGVASTFSWTGGLAWLVAVSPASRRGELIGQAFAAAVAGSLLGPVLGAIASVGGTRWTFSAVGMLELVLAAWAIATPAERPEQAQGPGVFLRSLGDAPMIAGIWFVVLPALLFGTLGVLVPLRLSALGFGAIAIGAAFLGSSALETVNNTILGKLADRHGTTPLLLFGLALSAVVAVVLPWPANPYVLSALVVVAGVAFGGFYTPGMTRLSHLSEERGLDHGYTFALVSLAWAPGQTLGAAGSGALAHATADAVPYVTLSALCVLTFAALARRRAAVTAAAAAG